MSEMHIGIDGREWRDPASGGATGVAQYLFSLLRALSVSSAEELAGMRFTLFLPEGTVVPDFLNDSEACAVRFLPAATRRSLVGPHVLAARAFRDGEIDVLHGPANVLPLAWRGPAVLTVHDLLIYDHPEWFPSGQWLSTKVVVPRSIRHARKVIVPSEAVKLCLERHFPGSGEKTVVIPHGRSLLVEGREVEVAWTHLVERNPFLVNDPYILFLGTIEPRKNCVRLVQAFKLLRTSMPHVRLVLAGKEGWGMSEAFLKQLPEGVTHLGAVTESEKAALLRHAACLAYPSLAEGFGLPLLEAMGEGVPIVTSDREPMKSLAGDAGFFCDPESTQSIASALEKALKNTSLITERVHKGREQVSRYTWQETALNTLTVYRSVLENPAD